MRGYEEGAYSSPMESIPEISVAETTPLDVDYPTLYCLCKCCGCTKETVVSDMNARE